MRASNRSVEPQQQSAELLDALSREQESHWLGLKAYKVTEPTESSTTFEAATDFSPMQYLKRIRLERALHLMDQEPAAGEGAFKVEAGQKATHGTERGAP